MSRRFKLHQTCGACPEQYDVYLENDYGEAGYKVGYLRLRHGYFRAEHNDKIVYTAEPRGDGSFYTDEREFYLNNACEAISRSIDAEEGTAPSNLYDIIYPDTDY